MILWTLSHLTGHPTSTLTGQASSQNLFMRNLRDREPRQISAVQQELQYHVMLRKALHNLILKMQRWILNENHFNFSL